MLPRILIRSEKVIRSGSRPTFPLRPGSERPLLDVGLLGQDAYSRDPAYDPCSWWHFLRYLIRLGSVKSKREKEGEKKKKKKKKKTLPTAIMRGN